MGGGGRKYFLFPEGVGTKFSGDGGGGGVGKRLNQKKLSKKTRPKKNSGWQPACE